MSDFDKELDTSGLNCPLPIIKAKKDKLIVLAERLMEREVIFKDDLEEIFGSNQLNDKTVVLSNEEE